MNLPKIETDRLVLRGIGSEDIDFIFEHFSDEDVCRYLYDAEPFTTREEAIGLVTVFSNPQNGNLNRWIITERETGKQIGTCGFMFWDKENHSAEIGYDLRKEYWGLGYMNEALRSALTYGFIDMKLNRIQAITFIGNSPSCKLLEKLGFKKEGIIRDKHFFRGQYYDHFCYSILKKEWE